MNQKSTLITIRPDLAKEWHPTKNGNLTPDQITYGSKKKVWWKCKTGHEWEQSPNARRKTGCPYCSNRRANDDNSLYAKHPKLSREWHPTKNGNLTPKQVVPGSKRKVWWKCKNGHEWKAVLYERAIARTSCPYCSNKKVDNRNCLYIKHPELCKEWHPTKNGKLTPKQVVPGSNKKVWWKCKNGHEWKAIINDRSRGIGCRFCAKQTSRAELRIYTELKMIFKNVSLRKKVDRHEIDIYLPDFNIGVEIDGYYWHKNKYNHDKKKGKELKNNNISLIRIREKGLKKINKIDIIANLIHLTVTDIKSLLKQIILLGANNTQINYFNTNSFLGEEEYQKQISKINFIPEDRSIDVSHPSLLKEWHPTKNGYLTPKDFSIGSTTKVWWKCKKGHEWQASPNGRARSEGCPFCSNQKVCRDNCLATANPELAKEWHPIKNGSLTPRDVVAHHTAKVWWKCQYGHEWQATPHKRSSGRGCPFCAGKKVCNDNSFAKKRPDLIKEWNYKLNGKITPEQLTSGSNKIVWWFCSKNNNHEWQASPKTRSKSGCPFCAGKRVSEDNCLAIVNPQLTKEWNYEKNNELTPNKITYGSKKKVWWKCKKGHEWQAAVCDRNNRGRGCPYCSRKSRKN